MAGAFRSLGEIPRARWVVMYRGGRASSRVVAVFFFQSVVDAGPSRSRRTYALRRGRETHTHTRASCEPLIHYPGMVLGLLDSRPIAPVCARKIAPITPAFPCQTASRRDSGEARVAHRALLLALVNKSKKGVRLYATTCDFTSTSIRPV